MFRRCTGDEPSILEIRYCACVTAFVVPSDVEIAAGWRAAIIVPSVGLNSMQRRTPAPQSHWAQASSGGAALNAAPPPTPAPRVAEARGGTGPPFSETSPLVSFLPAGREP